MLKVTLATRGLIFVFRNLNHLQQNLPIINNHSMRHCHFHRVFSRRNFKISRKVAQFSFFIKQNLPKADLRSGRIARERPINMFLFKYRIIQIERMFKLYNCVMAQSR